jgi:hypothetical protein
MAHFAPGLAQDRSRAAAAPKIVNVPVLSFEGTYTHNRTVDVSPLVFEGLYADKKTVNVPPLVFEGPYIGQKAAPSLSTPQLPAAQAKGVKK